MSWDPKDEYFSRYRTAGANVMAKAELESWKKRKETMGLKPSKQRRVAAYTVYCF